MTDFIRFECPACGKSIKAKPDQAGKSAKCPGRECGQTVQVPILKASRTEPPAAESPPPIRTARRAEPPTSRRRRAEDDEYDSDSRRPAPRSSGTGLLIAGGVGALLLVVAGIGGVSWFLGLKPEPIRESERQNEVAVATDPAKSPATREDTGKAAETPLFAVEETVRVPTPPAEPKSEKLPGINGPFFEYVGKSDAKVTGVDLGVGVNDPKPDSPPASRTLPSGSKEFFISVRFEREPDARRIGIDIFNDKGKVEILGGALIESRNNATGVYVLTMGRKKAASYEDGPHQAKVLLDGKVVALVNWEFGAVPLATPVARAAPQDFKFAEVRRIEAPRASSAAFTADGMRVVCATFELGLYEWEVATGKEIRRLPSQDKHTQIAVSNDFRRALSVHRPDPKALGTLHLWDYEAGKSIRSWPEPAGDWETYSPRADFAPDGASAVTLYQEPSVKRTADGGLIFGGKTKKEAFLWDTQTGKAVKPFAARVDHGIAFSPDGKHVISDDPEKVLSLGDAKTGMTVRKYLGAPGSALRSMVSADGKYVVASCSDGDKYAVVVWSAQTAEQLHKFDRHKTFALAMAISPDGQQLVFIERGEPSKNLPAVVYACDLATGKLLGSVEGPKGADVFGVAFSPDGRSLVTVGYDKQEFVQVWSLQK